MIGFDPTPDRNYLVQASYQREHPIIDWFNTQGLLNTTPILMGQRWFEILEWLAAYRGFAELLNYPRAAEIFNMVWGEPDPQNAAKRLPGLVTNVKTTRRSEAWMEQQPLRPIMHGYTWGS
jgi:hypothetical protein